MTLKNIVQCVGILLLAASCRQSPTRQPADPVPTQETAVTATPLGGPNGRFRMREPRIDTVALGQITLSDPYVFADTETKTYYLIGTGGAGRIQARKSTDLKTWIGPFTVFQADSTLWAGQRCQIWAPEMHKYRGKYYLFATLTSQEIIEKIPNRYDIPRRAMHLLVADRPEGPFIPAGKDQYTPLTWASLDGTLWVEDGTPYMVFCHEWLQIVDGTMELVRLKPDLSGTVGSPKTLFKASESPWSREMLSIHEKTYGLDLPGNVTDGPFLFKTQTGKLGMLWSGWSDNRYCLGVSYSTTGKVAGPWTHQAELLFKDNGGHAMLFRDFDGQLLMMLHYSDETHRGRTPMIMHVDDSGDQLIVKDVYIK